jgi:predicted RNA binding protein YcfA (HicA-like mRNA interferase family)
MPKLPSLRPREVIQALESVGFRVARQSGSHIQLKKGNLLVTVPNHPRDISPSTLRSILRQARLGPDEFIELL